MRLVYFGTPEVSVAPLRSLVDAGHEILLVVTRADKRRGRGGQLQPTPVKAAAVELGLPVALRASDVLDVNADLGVLVVFGQLIKPDVLAHLNILNIHPSLLPRWRGATPVESAILAGDTRTGVCVMQLEEGMDTGPVYARAETGIDPDESAANLLSRLIATGSDLLVDLLASPLPEPEPQTGDSTYAAKLTPEDLHIDWSRPSDHILRQVRVGRAWTTFRDKRFLILEARLGAGELDAAPGAIVGGVAVAGNGSIELVTVQPEGKSSQPAKAWANGARLDDADKFI